jgi:hypothetical protein
MTALSIYTMAFRVAAANVAPAALGQFLVRVYRCVAEVASRRGGELRPAGADDLLITWRANPRCASPEGTACLAACDIRERIEQIQPLLRLKYGVQLTPRMGIGSSSAGAIRSARLLQRANLFYQTAVLTDQRTARAGEGVELREIDRIDAAGGGLLWLPEAAQATGLPSSAIAEFAAAPTTIHELLGIRGRVRAGLLGFREAFQAGVRLYRSGDWRRAQAILEKLAAGHPGDPLIEIYLRSAREKMASRGSTQPAGPADRERAA